MYESLFVRFFSVLFLNEASVKNSPVLDPIAWVNFQLNSAAVPHSDDVDEK
jgi:hypothetical protein